VKALHEGVTLLSVGDAVIIKVVGNLHWGQVEEIVDHRMVVKSVILSEGHEWSGWMNTVDEGKTWWR
jgi:hypothetical protein